MRISRGTQYSHHRSLSHRVTVTIPRSPAEEVFGNIQAGLAWMEMCKACKLRRFPWTLELVVQSQGLTVSVLRALSDTTTDTTEQNVGSKS